MPECVSLNPEFDWCLPETEEDKVKLCGLFISPVRVCSLTGFRASESESCPFSREIHMNHHWPLSLSDSGFCPVATSQRHIRVRFHTWHGGLAASRQREEKMKRGVWGQCHQGEGMLWWRWFQPRQLEENHRSEQLWGSAANEKRGQTAKDTQTQRGRRGRHVLLCSPVCKHQVK